jgi:hypothetical protein
MKRVIGVLIYQVPKENKDKKSEEIAGKADGIIISTASKTLQLTVNADKLARLIETIAEATKAKYYFVIGHLVKKIN